MGPLNLKGKLMHMKVGETIFYPIASDRSGLKRTAARLGFEVTMRHLKPDGHATTGLLITRTK